MVAKLRVNDSAQPQHVCNTHRQSFKHCKLLQSTQQQMRQSYRCTERRSLLGSLFHFVMTFAVRNEAMIFYLHLEGLY